MFFVPHSDFNKANYPGIIGKTFPLPPGYANVLPVEAAKSSGDGPALYGNGASLDLRYPSTNREPSVN